MNKPKKTPKQNKSTVKRSDIQQQDYLWYTTPADEREVTQSLQAIVENQRFSKEDSWDSLKF